jgi:hypothetical protein
MRPITKISVAIHVALAALWLVPGHVAHADEDEASLHAHVQFGRATIGIREAAGQTDSAPFVGMGARATYATSNWYAYEASVWAGGLTSPACYTRGAVAGEESWCWRTAWVRGDLGVTVRLGVRFIPTLHAALGVQTRFARQGFAIVPATRYDDPRDAPKYAVPGHMAIMEMVGTLGAGLDYRLGDHWVAGLATTVQRTVIGEAPFQSLAATFHFSYYLYPEGAGP